MNESSRPDAIADTKHYIGMTFFVLSWVGWAAVFLIPLFDFDVKTGTSIGTGLVIISEVLFLAAIALLGKPFLQSIKTKIKSLFKKCDKPAKLRSVGKVRHYLGVFLFVTNVFGTYIIATIPFLGLGKEKELETIIIALIATEVLFVISLFLLGGEFWEKLTKLFCWQEDRVA